MKIDKSININEQMNLKKYTFTLKSFFEISSWWVSISRCQVDVPPGAPVEFQVLRDNDWNQRSSVNGQGQGPLMKLKIQWSVLFGESWKITDVNWVYDNPKRVPVRIFQRSFASAWVYAMNGSLNCDVDLDGIFHGTRFCQWYPTRTPIPVWLL